MTYDDVCNVYVLYQDNALKIERYSGVVFLDKAAIWLHLAKVAKTPRYTQVLLCPCLCLSLSISLTFSFTPLSFVNLISLLYFPLSLSPFSTLFLPLAICLTLAYSLTHSLLLSLPRHLSPAISCSLLLSLSIFLYLAIYLALALFCFPIITISRMFSPFFSLCLARPIWLSKYHSLSRYLALSRFLLLPLLLSGSDQFSCMPSYYISHALHFSPKHSLVISLALIIDISTSLTFLLSRSLLFFRYIFCMLALTLSHHLFFSCCLSRYLSLPLTFYPTSLSLATPPLSLSALSPCVVLSLYLCISLIIFSVCHFHAL